MPIEMLRKQIQNQGYVGSKCIRRLIAGQLNGPGRRQHARRQPIEQRRADIANQPNQQATLSQQVGDQRGT